MEGITQMIWGSDEGKDSQGKSSDKSKVSEGGASDKTKVSKVSEASNVRKVSEASKVRKVSKVSSSVKSAAPEAQKPAITTQPGEHQPQWIPSTAITSQPSAWHQVLTPQGLPPVMQHLQDLDMIEIQQQIEIAKLLFGWEQNNRYNIIDHQHRYFMLAKEETDCCTRQWCGTNRPFTMSMIDTVTGFPVIRLERPLRCNAAWCCCCCLQEMEVQSPPGQRQGTVREKWHCCYPKYKIYDAQNQVAFSIIGECCYCKCCVDVIFQVYDGDVDFGAQEVGQIIKRWNGCDELFGGVNHFTVRFPREMDVMKKIILLGATFLIDFNYFETPAS